jgi:hypothetical protein
MLKALKFVFTALLLLCSTVCLAQDGKADEQLVKQLMLKSGLSKQIEQFPAMMETDIVSANQEAGNMMSQSELDDLIRMALEAFNADTMNAIVQKHIQQNLKERDIRAVLKWLNSSLGKRISKLEEEASRPEAYEKIQAMAGEIDKKRTRAALLAKLDDAVKATDVGVSISTNIQVAFILALTAGMPADHRPSVDDILSEVNKDSEQLRTTIRKETLAGFMYAYRSLKDAEIKRYIAFAESKSGKRYHAITAEGLNHAVLQASLALGSKLSRSMDKEGRESF